MNDQPFVSSADVRPGDLLVREHLPHRSDFVVYDDHCLKGVGRVVNYCAPVLVIACITHRELAGLAVGVLTEGRLCWIWWVGGDTRCWNIVAWV